jgi:precorrin-3B methylase
VVLYCALDTIYSRHFAFARGKILIQLINLNASERPFEVDKKILLMLNLNKPTFPVRFSRVDLSRKE